MKRRMLAFLLVLCMTVSLLPATVGAAGTNMNSGNLNTAAPTKEQIQAKWKEVTSASSVYEVTPSVTAPYAAGSLSDSFLQSGLTYLNYVRYVAHLPSVQLTDEMNEAAQYGAVVMAAGDDFSHYPHQPEGMDDAFYNKGVAATSTSNISYNYGYNPLQSLQIAVRGCMNDTSSLTNLSCVGHRRWLLNPTLLNVGFGFAQSTAGANFTDTKVFDRSGSAISYNFISWPASGNFPTNLISDTKTPWSITLNPNKYQKPVLSNVTITLTRESDGKQWVFNASTGDASSTAAYMVVENSGYGVSNCIIFRPAAAEIGSYDGIYTVDVSGIYTTGGAEATLHYQVDFFDVTTYSGSESGHTHSYIPTVTAPTCTADGYTIYACSCGNSYTDDTVAALGHSYTGEVTKEATATEDGTRTYTCSRCGDVYTETIPALGTETPTGTTFTNFAELKALIAKYGTQGEELTYVGEGPLEIQENITIPDTISVDISADQVVVPSGVALSVAGELKAGTLTIAGTLNNTGEVYVMDALHVTGAVNQSGDFYMNSGVKTALSGADRITYSAQPGIIWLCGFASGSDLAEISAAASSATDSNWFYFVYPTAQSVSLSTSVILPDNCQLTISTPLELTVAAGSSLTIDSTAMFINPLTVNGDLSIGEDGYVILYAPLSVSGTLQNYGVIDLYYDDGGKLTVPNGASYNDDGPIYSGVIYVNSDNSTLPAGALSGLDPADFTSKENNDSYGHYWSLYYYDYTPATTPDDPEKIETVPMYRLYNRWSGEHFYTGSEAERDNLVAAGWKYEAIAWYAPVSGGVPIYRVYNPYSGEHHYTGSMDEVKFLVEAGWAYEDVAWNSPLTGVPVHRLFNPYATNAGSHHYTIDTEERDWLISIGWKYESVAWNGVDVD